MRVVCNQRAPTPGGCVSSQAFIKSAVKLRTLGHKGVDAGSVMKNHCLIGAILKQHMLPGVYDTDRLAALAGKPGQASMLVTKKMVPNTKGKLTVSWPLKFSKGWVCSVQSNELNAAGSWAARGTLSLNSSKRAITRRRACTSSSRSPRVCLLAARCLAVAPPPSRMHLCTCRDGKDLSVASAAQMPDPKAPAKKIAATTGTLVAPMNVRAGSGIIHNINGLLLPMTDLARMMKVTNCQPAAT